MPVRTQMYFDWLYSQICPPFHPESSQSYTIVCGRMYDMQFRVVNPRDENRIADAAQLRKEFTGLEREERFSPGVSILELLIGLARRMDFMIDWPVHSCFALFLENLNLDVFDDDACPPIPLRHIDHVLARFSNRTYKSDGRGGLFPLQRPEQDQRDVELWYQMAAYMTENEMY